MDRRDELNDTLLRTCSPSGGAPPVSPELDTERLIIFLAPL